MSTYAHACTTRLSRIRAYMVADVGNEHEVEQPDQKMKDHIATKYLSKKVKHYRVCSKSGADCYGVNDCNTSWTLSATDFNTATHVRSHVQEWLLESFDSWTSLASCSNPFCNASNHKRHVRNNPRPGCQKASRILIRRRSNAEIR